LAHATLRFYFEYDDEVDRNALAPELAEEARALDTLSGGMMGVEDWVNRWLNGTAPVT